MVVAVAVWSLELKPGYSESFDPPGDLRITNVALGDELGDENGRTTVKLTYQAPNTDTDEDDEEDEEEGGEPVTTVLCSLTPGKIEQTTIDLILEADREVLFESVGKNTVYLTGNYIDQVPPPRPFDEDFDSDDESDEDAYRLEDVSSDVEVDPAELDDDSHRLEEVDAKDEDEDEAEAVPKHDSRKRPRESDTADADESKLSKSQQKKLNKKLKAEGGKAVPTGEEKDGEAKKDGKKDGKKEEKKVEKDEQKEKSAAPKGETKELSGGVKIRDHRVGSGPQAKNGDLVSMRYVGKLQNGKLFDSNTKGAPFKFRLGKGEVIKGWDIGIAGMQSGGERLLTIPPAMAYGKKATSGIPANSTLTFEVKLLKIN